MPDTRAREKREQEKLQKRQKQRRSDPEINE
jgi:hypothetical protein